MENKKGPRGHDINLVVAVITLVVTTFGVLVMVAQLVVRLLR